MGFSQGSEFMQMHKCIFGCIAFYAFAIHFYVFRNESENAQY